VKGWRIVRPEYAANPLSGVGAARTGSRWNSQGVRLAYASTSRPLAVLETFVHVISGYYPLDALLVPVEIPDDLITELDEVPNGWNNIPPGDASRRIGDRWIEKGSSLAMLVPSAVLPSERNILVNPAHAQFRRIRIGEPEPNAFDRRLFAMEPDQTASIIF
jgi:RES domain-containing protein